VLPRWAYWSSRGVSVGPSTADPEKKKTSLVVRLVAAIALGAVVGGLLGPRAAL
jgi:hypothetical protein